jgi:DNA-binding IclR family transcriptional regulator
MSQAEEETGRPRSSLQRYEPALEKLGALRRDKDQNVVVVLRVALLELLARKHRR